MGALVWLASYPKSGNTWVRAFLYCLLRDSPGPPDLDSLDRFCLGESHSAWYHRRLGKPPEQASAQEIARARPLVHRDFTSAFPDSVFVKTHNMMGEWLGSPLHNMEVTAGAIYVVRNPLDVAVSMTHHFGLDCDQAAGRLADTAAASLQTARHVPEVHSSWSVHVRSWTARAHTRLCILRYEDLVAQPELWFGKLAGFLGLSPPRARLARAVRNASFEALRQQERRAGFKERPAQMEAFFRKGSPGEGRDVLTEAQIQRICSDHRQEMMRFGYLQAAAAR